jgi:NADPH:quinone reductase-like Zn-dependent oxidoreductase
MVEKPGSYDALRLDSAPIGEPQSKEVQVQVKACGINFADISVRLGLYGAAKGGYPICPGLEFAGTVGRVGSHAQNFEPGDQVFGACRFGGYSTAINCPQEHLWKLPTGWSMERGAAFSVAYLTAHYALHHVGHLGETDVVLVHSAAGGVGTALLHLLAINGNKSVGVVGGTSKVAHAEAAGAMNVIDKSHQDLWEKAESIHPLGYDIILDANGASTLKGSYDHLKPAGRLLIYGFASMFSHSGSRNWPKLIWDYLRTPRFSPFDLTQSNKTVSGFNLIYLFENVDLFRAIMKELLGWNRSGLLPAMPITTFDFEDVADAHRALESGKTVGKLVLAT